MKLYVTPKSGGPVIFCESHTQVSAAMRKLHDEGYGAEFDITRGDIVCDFCSTPMVKWLYEIVPDGSYSVTMVSETETETHGDGDGKWAACPDCHAMISGGQWDILAVRAIARMREEAPELPVALATLAVQGAHGYFHRRWEANHFKPPTELVSDAEFLNDAGISDDPA